MELGWNRLAAAEWRRRPWRSGLMALAVAVSVAMVSLLSGFQRGYRMGLQGELDRLGAHILVVPKGCPYDAASIALHGANWPCYLREEYLREVRAVPQVGTAAPALMGAFPAGDGTQEVFVGVTEELLALKPGWKVAGNFPKADDEVLLGAGAAQALKASVGGRVRMAELGGREFRVAGIGAATGGADDGFVYLPMAAAQRAFRRERQFTHILVRLRDPDGLEAAVQQLRGCNAGMDMNVIPMTHLFETIQGMVRSTRAWLASVAAVALLVAAAGIANAVLSAVSERTREIGVLRAVGASRFQVFRLVWTETLVACLAGGLVGVVAARLSGGLAETWLRSRIPFAPADALVRIEPPVVLVGLAAAVGLALAAGVVPALRAASLPPAVALRKPGGAW